MFKFVVIGARVEGAPNGLLDRFEEIDGVTCFAEA